MNADALEALAIARGRLVAEQATAHHIAALKSGKMSLIDALACAWIDGRISGLESALDGGGEHSAKA